METKILKKMTAAAFSAAVLFVAMFGCQMDGDKRSVSGQAETGPVHKHPPYLRLPMEGSIETIDPGLTLDMASIEIVEQLFLGLTDFDHRTYEVVPELATRWTVSEDARTYRFFMRKDALWSNGEPVTAHDVVWAVRRNIDPELQSPYAHTLFVLKNAEAIFGGKEKDMNKLGVRAIDDYTVEFTLAHEAAYFPALVGIWVYRPLPFRTVSSYGKEWTDPRHIQTNGSYMLSEWKKGKVMILQRNTLYYDADKVSIPEVRYYILPESSAGMVMYRKGNLDIIGGSYLPLPLMDIPNIKADPVLNREYSNNPELCTFLICFNNKRPPVDKPLVRKAISAAIDRRLLVDVVTKGDQEPAATFTRPPIFGSVDPGEGVGIRFNPEQAKTWLAQAGYPDGKGFPEVVFMYNTSDSNANIAQAVQTFLKHYLNIDIRLEEKPWSDYMKAIEQPETPHMFRFAWCADYPDANNWLNEVFHPFKSQNRIGWSSREFAMLMDKAQGTTDQEERKRLYRRAEQILTEEEAAIVPLFFRTAQYLVKPRVKGWYHMALGGQQIRNWRLEE